MWRTWLPIAVCVVSPVATAASVARTEAPPSVAVLRLQAGPEVDAQTAAIFSAVLVEEARLTRFKTALSPEEVDLLMTAPVQDQLAKCAQDVCSVLDEELVGPLGVSHILAGTVTRLGDAYAIRLVLLDLRAATEEASLVRTLDPPSDEKLLEAFRPIARELFAKSRFTNSSPSPAEPASTGPRLLRMGGAGALAGGAAFGLVGIAGLFAALASGAVLSLVDLRIAGLYSGPIIIKGGPLFAVVSVGAYAAAALGVLAVLAATAFGVGGGAVLVLGLAPGSLN